jgi:hypothetical protein
MTQQEIWRTLSWAAGCDGESFIDERDWPLIKQLAEKININPASVVPNYAREAGFDPSTGYQFDRHPVWS